MSDIEFSLSSESKQLLERLIEKGKDAGSLFGEAVRELGLEAAEQVARNLSGVTVSHDGQNFSINVDTGNLRRSTRIDWPMGGNPMAVRVVNNASYADAVQRGSSGRERKAALLQSPKAKMSAEGRRYIFVPAGPGPAQGFTVTEESVLSDIAPRPFLEAAADQMEPRASNILRETIARALKD